MPTRFLLILCCCCLAQIAPAAEETPTPVQSLQFETGKVSHYIYTSKQSTTQFINDDEIKINSTISWKFALRCLRSDQNSADLTLTIEIIKAQVKAPAFEHSISTADNDPQQVKTPVIGHLCLLNGISLNLVYDYQTQSLQSVSGAEHIHQRFKKMYPDDEFAETEAPEMKLVREQYSNQALLRLWREILRPGRRGQDSVQLDAPLQITVQRQWQAADQDIVPYSISYQAAADAQPLSMPLGQHQVAVRLDSLSGGGKIRVVDGVLLEATGQTSAEMHLTALTQGLKQKLLIEWALQRDEHYQGDAQASEDSSPE